MLSEGLDRKPQSPAVRTLSTSPPAVEYIYNVSSPHDGYATIIKYAASFLLVKERVKEQMTQLLISMDIFGSYK